MSDNKQMRENCHKGSVLLALKTVEFNLYWIFHEIQHKLIMRTMT